MSRPSLAQLNAEFAAHHFELVKGAGYFYFASTADAPDHALEEINPESVMVCNFKDLGVSRWRAAMADVAEALRRHRAQPRPSPEAAKIRLQGALARMVS